MEEPTIYVVTRGEHAICASASLDAAKKAAEKSDSEYLTEPREYRWDEESFYGHKWQLMTKNTQTKRWNKTSYVVQAVPLVDASTA